MNNVVITGPDSNQSESCAPILRHLPQWFGRPEHTEQYIRDIATLPTWLAICDDKAVGFITIKNHFPQSAEIHVMGVMPEFHRHGIGQKLVHTAEQSLKDNDVQYLQVKTLSDSHADKAYAQTRNFYQAVGFSPLQVFEEIWGEDSPCLLMIKPIQTN